MQAGKVDIPGACRVCGANLNDDAAETCGRDCERKLKRRRAMQALIGAAPGDFSVCEYR
jgi:predicted nucleic acid-binding Zn ribbon protein